ncbi:ABC transporter ATP-binding protein [Isoptericola sp. BMS4]|uniref:ABC transporter ATP-binding protein n=1 Tax=Isoptericola sp. BMS4 TaxID=2527875 RepID=UPI0014247285|nr:ABC transporter ATP-binding protein [Isoptericola sp. BMS4]
MTTPVLSVRDLTVSFPSEAGRVDAVRGVSFDVAAGRTLGIVGESGSGKSVTSLAVMGLLDENASIGGSVTFDGQELLGKSDAQMSKIRGNGIAMIFQDPLTSLTPVFTVGDQIVEALTVHNPKLSKRAAWDRAVELLRLVGIPRPQERVRSFPHEFSGGMRQRVVIAIAMANDPKLIIADEPTTALDVTIQAQILDLIKTAQRETGAAVMMITHDMGVVANVADDVLVMYAGRAIEQAPVDELFADTRMPYSIGLLGAIPRVDKTEKTPLVPITGAPPLLVDLPDACPFADRCPIVTPECRAAEPALVTVGGKADHRAACIRAEEIRAGRIDGGPVYPVPEVPASRFDEVPRDLREPTLEVENLTKSFPLTKGAFLKRKVGEVHAVKGVSFDVREGETMAIVGESGSGKTTTLLQIMDFAPQDDGDVRIVGTSVADLKHAREERALRRDVQIVFQDPMGSLDPRMTVFDVVAEPLRTVGTAAKDIGPRVDELLDLVGLDPAHSDRFPAAFSGGQRQRIGIARALATNPKLVVLDEPVSALDVSVQAGVINLLDELKGRLGLSYLFVAHDLSVVRHIADRVAVMYLGSFVEHGDVDEVFDDPQHPYTRALLSAIPVPDPVRERTREHIVLTGDLPSPTDTITGCAFVSRCPLYQTLDPAEQTRCETEVPALTGRDGVHVNACHYR